MAISLTETTFIAIVGCMILTLAGLSALAKYNHRRKIKKISAPAADRVLNGTAKIIPLPQNKIRPTKELLFIQEAVSEEETV